MLQHVRNATRTEGHGLHATGVDIAFVNDGRIQVARHVDRTGRDQVEAPGHRAQHWQRTVFLQLSGINFHDLRFGRVVENFRQVRAGTALLIHRGVQFVHDHAGDVAVFRAAEAAAGQLNTLFQLFRGISPLGHHEHDFRVQRFGNFEVQGLGKLMLARRNQAFNQHDFRILCVSVIVSDDLFHQHVFLVAGKQRLNVAHLQRFSGGQIRVRTNDSCGLVWRIATSTWLSDRLEHAQANAFTFHRTDHTEADAGQAYAGSGRDQHNSTGHDLSSFVTAENGRATKQHRQHCWRCGIRQSDGSRLAR